MVHCSVDGRNVFSFSKGIRLLSDLKGNLMKIIGIDKETKKVSLEKAGKIHSFTTRPDAVYRLDDSGECNEIKPCRL